MAYINLKIKRLREGRNLTQKEFADAVGISRATLASYESGTPPSEKSILKIASYLGISVEDIFSGNDKKINTLDRQSIRRFVDADINRRVSLILKIDPMPLSEATAAMPQTVEELQYQVEYLSDLLAKANSDLHNLGLLLESQKGQLDLKDKIIALLEQGKKT